MTFSNLCALYENACLDYEVSVLTEGADSEEAKTAKAKKTGLAKKVFAAVGAAFQKLWEMIKRLLTFIKRRFVREKIKLANDVNLVPVKEYKKILANRTDMIVKGVKIQTFPTMVKIQTIPVKAGTIVDKTAYVEILEKLEKIAKRYTSLRIEAENLVKKNSEYTNTRQGIHEYNDSVQVLDNYKSLEKGLNRFVRLINRDIQAISSNAVPEDVAPVDNNKEDTNNESIMFDGLTKNELRAKLLIEAADLLNEGTATVDAQEPTLESILGLNF